MTKRQFMCAALMLAVALGGCTSGNDTSDDDNGSNDNAGNNNGGGSDNNGGDDTPSTSNPQLGSFDDQGRFTAGRIVTSNETPRSNQATTLSLRLVDRDGNVLDNDSEVFFTSACARDGRANIDPSVTTPDDGQITTTYTPLGCDTNDTVTARTSINDQTLTANVTLRPQATTAAALSFTATSQAQIGIQGTGVLQPQSQVTFRLTDAGGDPVPGQMVTFSPDTTVGGLSIAPERMRTNADGLASTTVTAGTQAASVQIGATSTGADGRTLSAQSRTLAVTTGIADQDSFSISAASTNIEGFNRDGVTTAITVRAADRFNNPVPDGTTINFTTEGGAIPGSCQTTDGACSVDFVSQNPRPGNGRVTILATAIGEESFTDSAPSNGRFDAGEAYDDLPEAYLDRNENGRRDADEPYADFNDDGNYNAASDTFNGLLCDAGNQCGASDTINVRGQVVVVLSGSSLSIDLPDTINLGSSARTITVSVADANGQKPPSGTTIAATTSQGRIEGPSSYAVPIDNSAGPYEAEFRIEPGSEAGRGILRVTVTTPNDVISRDTARVVQSQD
ncbi:Ig-like domain-containing protein [Salinisphaera sp. Q1T1-3]|uniref:Ig-like domain-containing protein n=1 Tax=Salinisphaera sp. Q1T1-3 TaxID=2321229 RepID=UPI000E772C61|nr:Ig-like domain-containing protein [Salinisphaera sp. Q1T1-3]RJS94299.1 hypothetical protein D3260_04100 [Salinisphaera sp. Q1T1-3]